MNEIPRDPRRPVESSRRRFRIEGVVARNEIGTDPKRNGQGSYRKGTSILPVEKDTKLRLTVAGMACMSLKKVVACGPAATEELASLMVKHSTEMDLGRVFPNL